MFKYQKKLSAFSHCCLQAKVSSFISISPVVFFFFPPQKIILVLGYIWKSQDRKTLPKKTSWYIPSVKHPQMLITYEKDLRSKWKWKLSSKSNWGAVAVIQLSVCLDPLFLTLQLKPDTSSFTDSIFQHTLLIR